MGGTSTLAAGFGFHTASRARRGLRIVVHKGGVRGYQLRTDSLQDGWGHPLGTAKSQNGPER